ncbi:hypothetical protein CRENPOLYSF2_2570014 [Crenothrix polyspora]|uniref:Uncharacterized protein n=1 Tax=Crenothrix polyspora TaxID=360316 RepID=A0A1R4H7H2_9GAMM|nr:hypothetical protein CRENPOLYSF2_2570014 [Crenothrix polyspora]
MVRWVLSTGELAGAICISICFQVAVGSAIKLCAAITPSTPRITAISTANDKCRPSRKTMDINHIGNQSTMTYAKANWKLPRMKNPIKPDASAAQPRTYKPSEPPRLNVTRATDAELTTLTGGYFRDNNARQEAAIMA